MTFRAHELIQNMPDAQMRKVLETAVKFDFGTLDEALGLFSISTRSLFDIPFPSCLFQVDEEDGTVQFFLARKVDDGVLWQAFARYPGGYARALVSTFVYLDGRGCLNKKENEVTASSFEELSEGEQEVIKSMHTMAAAVEVFSCCNVTTIENQPPKFINAKRVAKGKVPFFSYRTLHITLDASEPKDGKGCGTHAGPRLHLRRGHIRRLADRRVWVRSSIVGDKSKGLAEKDYRVHAKKIVGASIATDTENYGL